jgi:uncharacterized protein YwqG
MNDKVVQAIRAAVPRLASEIEVQLLNAVRIDARLMEHLNLPVGVSRFGGTPDLPPEIEWPYKDETLLGFIAQLNIEEVSSCDSEHALPRSGILYFFYDADKQPWGSDPEDRGSWRVLYYPGGVSGLVRREIPANLSRWNQFPMAVMSFSKGPSIPPIESLFVDSLNLMSDEMDAYLALESMIAELNGGSTLQNQLLGHPQPIQGEMQVDCQFASTGTRYDDLYADQVRAGAADWRLLLQVDSNEELHMQWGDGGMIYYWIRREALQAGDFSDVWLSLQCF